ncbi:AbrB family transcriptional regulator [Aestuariicoccus sp. MJ-SS9]|uniref:AbrB family transcriptional regulator n=1 Tax=Aestuariicoccus sp. MJ-SS9 TaxID=3079855 RepID=UPI002907272D|nr:AbrB family transcriptional regulator [Aestuariicoccus sp. MJ-SS9]MDU8912655.1 AbrB family transcriptional regulator [Aestuariicoccus sp. MJ-SS9]
MPAFDHRTIALTAALLMLGAAGGAVAQALSLPMPWMLGSLAASGVAVGLLQDGVLRSYSFPQRFRTFFVGLIGVMIGTQVTPELLGLAGELPLTLGALVIFVALAHGGNHLIFRRIGGYDPPTAFYAATPGGIMESLFLGERAGADLRILTSQQFLRIIFVVTLVPAGLSIWLGHPVGSAAGMSAVGSQQPLTAATLGLIATVTLAGLAVAHFIHLPAAQITGPLLLAAGLTVWAGLDLQLPVWLIMVAQVVVGVSLGMRFKGVTAAMLRRSVWLSALSVGYMLILGGVFAVGLAQATDIPFLHLLISYAPGGVTEMSVIALSLAANPALVSLHHVSRILMTVAALAVAQRVWGGAR